MATQRTQQKRGRTTTAGRATRSTRGGRSQRTTRKTAKAVAHAPRGARRGRNAYARDFAGAKPDVAQVEELILQGLETEMGGVQVYETAVLCAVNEDLKGEWQKYLKQTRHHVEVVQQLCQQVGIDAGKETPGRGVVRHIGESLVQAMQQAQQAGEPEAAELVAAECVTLAETKDHLNWSLMSELSKADFPWAKAIKAACDEVEDEEDEHLYHTMGWTRELWISSFGLPAALPPPEEEKDVKSMAGAAQAKAQRKQYVTASKPTAVKRR